MVDSSMSFSSSSDSGGTGNPYVLQCLDSSDGSAVSLSLKKLVQPGSAAGANKISSLDWDQSIDLIVSFDVECLVRTNFSDPILNYVNASGIDSNQRVAAILVKKEDVRNLDLFIKAALDSECLKSAEKNEEVKIAAVDPYYSYQSHLQSTGANPYAINATATVFADIQSYVNNAAYPTYDHVVKVAVIDTGIDGTNPDLAPVLAYDTGTGTYLGENTSDSGASTEFLTDSGWHGTHVSGLIAAQYDNGIGVTGVAGRNVALYPFKGSSNGSTFNIYALSDAIESAASYNVDIINMSVGTTTNSSILRDAINAAMAKNITFVVAAGNGDASGTGQTLTSSFPVYPAMYSSDSNGLITVGSLDLVTQSISPFSNKSNVYVDLMAPGSNMTTYDYTKGILSTIPMSFNINSQFSPNYPSQSSSVGPGIGSLIDQNNNTAKIVQGTSMATPIVTGALANIISMVKSRGKTVTNNQLKTWLRGAGSPTSTAYQAANYTVGGKFLNLETLVSYAKTQIPNLPNASGTVIVNPNPNPEPAPTNPPVNPTLAITQQPLPKQAVVGESVTLSVRTSNVPNITYQWYKNNILVSGATSQDLVLSNIQAAQGGSYKVAVRITGTTLISNSVNVIVGYEYCN